MQAVTAAKTTKYLRTVLNKLGVKQRDPTMVYKDDAAAIMMTNVRKPDSYTCHTDMNYFALQEW
eukprot:2951933-Ditylum_brightwellii.AAC.1